MILTSDAASILRELDVVHPAAKLIVMASQQQEAEMGDATNMVIVLAGELLRKAEELLRMGLKTSDVVQGYERAQKEALRCLDRAYAHPVVDHTSRKGWDVDSVGRTGCGQSEKSEVAWRTSKGHTDRHRSETKREWGLPGGNGGWGCPGSASEATGEFQRG